MASKALLLLLATFLLVTTRVFSNDEELKTKVAYAKVPTPAPSPPKIPVVKPPTPPVPPVEAPKTHVPPVKAPPVAVPPVKTPVAVPPPVKPPVAVKPPLAVPPPANPPIGVSPVNPPTTAPIPPVRSKADCTPLCNNRCQEHSRKNVCTRVCITCCDRCKCVPPGTFGNREKCGKCYTDMTTRGNKPKCP